MLVFLYLLAALGVAYWAKLDGRSPTVWLGAALVLTPLRGPAQKAHLTTVSGDFKDLAVVGGTLANGAGPTLFACVGQHWLKPLELPDVASLPALARVDDERWLVAGRERSGRAMLAIYHPLEWRIERLSADDVRAYLAGASAPQAASPCRPPSSRPRSPRTTRR